MKTLKIDNHQYTWNQLSSQPEGIGYGKTGGLDSITKVVDLGFKL